MAPDYTGRHPKRGDRPFESHFPNRIINQTIPSPILRNPIWFDIGRIVAQDGAAVPAPRHPIAGSTSQRAERAERVDVLFKRLHHFIPRVMMEALKEDRKPHKREGSASPECSMLLSFLFVKPLWDNKNLKTAHYEKKL